MEAPPSRLAVVGQNLSAALWLEAAVARQPGLSVSWHLTEMERTNSPDSFWLCLPERALTGLLKRQAVPFPNLPLQEIFIFGPHSQRLGLRDFLETSLLPLACRRRLLAAALANDLTPSLWRGQGDAREPDPNWPHVRPDSFASEQIAASAFRLVPRALALQSLSEYLEKMGIQRVQNDCAVTGVEAGVPGEGYRLVHNAPFGFTTSEKILWASRLSPPREEERGRKQRLKTTPPEPEGRWVSRGAWVTADRTAGLPNFSIWLEHSAWSEFAQTGWLRSKSLKRVFAIEGSVLGRSANETWLQVDELELHTAPFESEAVSPESFLRELCPRLGAEFSRAEVFSLDENAVEETPDEKLTRLASGFDLWHRSGLGDPDAAAESWLRKNFAVKEPPKG